MPLQVLVGEFVGYSALFLRTIEGKPTCPQNHKLDPYESPLVLLTRLTCCLLYVYCTLDMNRLIQLGAAAHWRLLISAAAHRVCPQAAASSLRAHPGFWLRDQ